MTARRQAHTPITDNIWSTRQTRARWHHLWIEHLRLQMQLNPDHPATIEDFRGYEIANRQYRTGELAASMWDTEVDQVEQETRHDLYAALLVFNRRAGSTMAHHGLTSCDITETANQIAICETMTDLSILADAMVTTLADEADRYRIVRLVARTHGRPAQVTTYGHRLATVLGPLMDWQDRLEHWIGEYPMRPPHGAVGTGADLERVLTDSRGETPDLEHAYSNRLASRNGFALTMQVTRQTYHRSYDIGIAALIAEFATIAATWADDRRHEAMLGLGNEQFDEGQVGSSAMPHKRNPILTERLRGVAQRATSHVSVFAAPSPEWFEGDVSASALRRESLYRMFADFEATLSCWVQAMARWEPDTAAMEREAIDCRMEIATGAIVDWLVKRGLTRELAHATVSTAFAAGADPKELRRMIVGTVVNPGVAPGTPEWAEAYADLLVVLADASEPGSVDGQIKRLVRTAREGNDG